MGYDEEGLSEVLGGTEAARLLRDVAPTTYDTVARYWSSPASTGRLTPRMRELLLLAMHATPTALDSAAIDRQVRRALRAGATEADVVDVVTTVVGVANHALYSAVPILEEELQGLGVELVDEGSLDDEYERTKAEFTRVRGFWNPDRDRLARLMPEYFAAVCQLSVEPWKNGSLSTKEREFVCIAIDCTVTHGYEPGLRLHIRGAVQHGADPAEILEIFQLAGLVGLESLSSGLRGILAH